MSIAEARALTGLYHETQIGALCGQHVLNNLLQGNYVTLDSLREIAQKLDHCEHEMLHNRPSEPYNLEAGGFCNIQVIEQILKNAELELIPFNSRNEIAEQARRQPTQVRAYLCNCAEHWFAIRKFGHYYFDLNSMYTLPHYMSDEYLPVYLSFIQENLGSIFIVHGRLIDCEAEERLKSPSFNMNEYVRIVQALPPFSIDQRLLGGLKSVNEGNDLVLRMPRIIMEKLQNDPDSPETQKIIDSYLPPHLKGKITLKLDGPSKKVAILSKGMTVMRRLDGPCDCDSCKIKQQVITALSVLDNFSSLPSRTAADDLDFSDIDENSIESDINSTDPYELELAQLKLMKIMLLKRKKFKADIQAFEEAQHRLLESEYVHAESMMYGEDIDPPDENLHKEFLKRSKILGDYVKSFKKMQQMYDQIEIKRAIRESLSTMQKEEKLQVPAKPELMLTKPSISMVPEQPPQMLNSQPVDEIIPDSSLTFDDDQRSQCSSLPIEPEMTVEELRILRQKKFGNRNVSLIGRIYSSDEL